MFYKDFKSFYFDASFIKTYIGFNFWFNSGVSTRKFKLELGFFRFTFIWYRK